MQPLIGVTCSSDPEGGPRVNPRYVQAVHAVRALPVPLPFVRTEAEAHALLDRLDGIVFTGSEDLDPALWGEARHPQTSLMHEARMTTELLLARAVLARRTPALGICGGMQTLNVASGGSLHQHIPDVAALVDHRDPSFLRRHEVHAEFGSRLAELLGASFPVNTEHHQAVNRLGCGLRVVARAPDGIIEAFESTAAPFLLGVQWHPERMLEDGRQRSLFVELAAAAAAGAG
ncbi:MAG TPA: gamma-glutamyl-gamma-aminobutyrate hydrolase family protein [Planctomycetota bacterium]|nr:gamma-glutamyl-gamma-aminobutyrate hydrolase family protein [Planctomycetota bacterium]